jgi:hypothetical protein
MTLTQELKFDAAALYTLTDESRRIIEESQKLPLAYCYAHARLDDRFDKLKSRCHGWAEQFENYRNRIEAVA